MVRDQSKTHRYLGLAVGPDSLRLLFNSAGVLHQKTLNSCRYSHDCHSLSLLDGGRIPDRLVAASLILSASLSGVLMLVAHHLLEELGQARNQAIPAADDMQAAFVLMLFQDFVQTALKFVHGR